MDDKEIRFVKRLVKHYGKIDLYEFAQIFLKRFNFYPVNSDLAYLKIEDGFVEGLNLNINPEEAKKRAKKFQEIADSW